MSYKYVFINWLRHTALANIQISRQPCLELRNGMTKEFTNKGPNHQPPTTNVRAVKALETHERCEMVLRQLRQMLPASRKYLPYDICWGNANWLSPWRRVQPCRTMYLLPTGSAANESHSPSHPPHPPSPSTKDSGAMWVTVPHASSVTTLRCPSGDVSRSSAAYLGCTGAAGGLDP